MAEKKLRTAYGLNTDLTKGQRKMLYLHGKPIAYLKKHSLSVKTDVEELATKFSGDFDDKLGGKTSYSISCEALVSNTDEHMSAVALRHLMYSGKEQPFEICWSRVVEEAGKRRIAKGDIVAKGNVIITEVGEESEHGTYETVSLSLEGSGALLEKSGKPYGAQEFITALEAAPQSDPA